MATHPTMSFEKPSVEDRFRVLPNGVAARDIVEAARGAGLAFVVGSAFGWGAAQLRSWLVLDYEPAVVWTRVADGRAPHDPIAGLDEVDVATLVDSARDRMMRMLLTARVNWKPATFARDMIDARLAVAVYDRDGEEAYAPAVHADMRLIDRVMSLFVSDYLSRPADYDRIVSCDACGEVAIGTAPRHLCWCAEPPAQSGIVERSRSQHRYDGRFTLRGVG
jgi:hypothetical protein